MKIPILMYHQIDMPPARGTPLRGLIVAPSSFAWQMAMLKVLGYQALSMRDLEPYLAGEKQGRVVGITFDDGFQNNVQHALPVLLKHGFTATCYAVSQAIGGTNRWDLQLGIVQKPLMTAEDWKQWLKSGMEIGSHTRNHANLNELSREQAIAEIKGSKDDLEATFACKVRHFCYPYGWFSEGHKQLVQDAGYITATTTRRGKVTVPADLFALKRVMVARATHLGLFAVKVLTEYEDRRT
jgi:peptidoglycan/xylan/chitin deacetylase (PgdA/CDA1 family)